MVARKVAIYARVSTEHEAQLSALDNQVQYYDNLLKLHQDWELVERYIDEGITGTSVKKRKNFMRMMDDALNHKFDLVITREVSRFARNTVDTLQQTRLLKKYGVEVYFSEDNIWTMNEDDGELKLTLMATLAQNESKKTSVRVKSGQAVSFRNGVFYGNGNILGYDKVDKEFIINKDQARTVRIIFDLYLQGWGLRKIQYELERLGRVTATGMKRWSCSCISRILNNAFYCGVIVYRKEVVLDYLEQKKIKNHDLVDKVIVEGSHEPIILKEEFDDVQKILNSKTSSIRAKESRGVKPCLDIWSKKLECSCGVSLNRKRWHVTSNGDIQYAYQCYNQINSGTIATRIKKGLSTEGICDSPMIPGWKMSLMAFFMFQKFWEDKEEVMKIANEMLQKHIADDETEDNADKVEAFQEDISKQQDKLDKLIEMRMEGEIPKEMYLKKKSEIEKRIEALQEELAKYVVDEEVDDINYEDKLKVLQYGLEQEFDFSKQEIPEEIIDVFVRKIVVYKDYFDWYLCFTEEPISCKVEGSKKKNSVSFVKTPSVVQRSTGSAQ